MNPNAYHFTAWFTGGFALPVWAWIGIGLLVVLAVAWARFIRYWRAWTKFEATDFLPPFRIHLVPADDTGWTQSPVALTLTGQLRELGYQDAGVFVIPEMPGTQLHGFVQTDAKVVGIVYQAHGKMWVDLETHYQNGSSICYSTASLGEELPQPSDQWQIRLSDLSLPALHHRLVTDRPKGVSRPVSPGDFASVLETDYAKKQDWLAERGGYTAAELHPLVPSPEKVDAEEMDELADKVAREALKNWWRQLPDAPGPPRGHEDCVAIVHDRMNRDQVLFVYCRLTGDWDTNEKHIPVDAKSPRAMFAALNEVRKGGLVKFIEKSTPLYADFYTHQADAPNEPPETGILPGTQTENGVVP